MSYPMIRFFVYVFLRMIFRLKAEGQENIPSDGPVILCPNHRSYWDPLIVPSPMKRKVWFMAKRELFSNGVIGAVLRAVGAFPVRRGGIGKETIRTVAKLLEEGRVLCIFPEGTSKNKTFGEGKKGAAVFALRSDAVVVPVAIKGQYKWFRPMTIQYGPPVDLTEFAEDRSPDRMERATESIMQSIKALLDSQPSQVQ